MTLAHLAGIPLEELLALAPAAGALWVALRALAPTPSEAASAPARRAPSRRRPGA